MTGAMQILRSGQDAYRGDGVYDSFASARIMRDSAGWLGGGLVKAGCGLGGGWVIGLYCSGLRREKGTQRECGFEDGCASGTAGVDVVDADIDKIHRAGISDTQQYSMAGNSIVVDVLCHIFRKMLTDKQNDNLQQTLF